MMSSSIHHPDEETPEAPKALSDDLWSLYRSRVHVPPEVDRAVLEMARSRFAGRRRSVLVLRWATVGAAAAALLLALSVMVQQERPLAPRAPSTRSEAAVRQDVDGNGRVDILDAFALARHIEARDKRRHEWDVNGDGDVNQADVDTVAMAAVSLEKGTLQ
jgi:hypothetical protein